MSINKSYLFLLLSINLLFCGESNSQSDKGTTMDSNLSALDKSLHSNNRDTSIWALAELIKIGRPALPVFTKAISDPDNNIRAFATEGLATIADSTATDLLFDKLGDNDEKVRAWAAAGLMNANDPRALNALFQTINDYPNILESEHTLSSHNLVRYGPAAAPGLLNLLTSEDLSTRTRAFAAFSGIVVQAKGSNKWSEIWEANGSYSPEMPPEERLVSLKLWTKWYEQNL